MLQIINQSLDELLAERVGPITSAQRISIFLSTGIKEFTRKTYLDYFKTISSATASRDLLEAVQEKLVTKTGDKNKTIYLVIKASKDPK